MHLQTVCRSARLDFFIIVCLFLVLFNQIKRQEKKKKGEQIPHREIDTSEPMCRYGEIFFVCVCFYRFYCYLTQIYRLLTHFHNSSDNHKKQNMKSEFGASWSIRVYSSVCVCFGDFRWANANFTPNLNISRWCTFAHESFHMMWSA